MKQKEKKSSEQGASEKVLRKMDRVVPGFRGFFKTAEKSKTFGPRMKEIRREMERRFGKVKK